MASQFGRPSVFGGAALQRPYLVRRPLIVYGPPPQGGLLGLGEGENGGGNGNAFGDLWETLKQPISESIPVPWWVVGAGAAALLLFSKR